MWAVGSSGATAAACSKAPIASSEARIFAPDRHFRFGLSCKPRSRSPGRRARPEARASRLRGTPRAPPETAVPRRTAGREARAGWQAWPGPPMRHRGRSPGIPPLRRGGGAHRGSPDRRPGRPARAAPPPRSVARPRFRDRGRGLLEPLQRRVGVSLAHLDDTESDQCAARTPHRTQGSSRSRPGPRRRSPRRAPGLRARSTRRRRIQRPPDARLWPPPVKKLSPPARVRSRRGPKVSDSWRA